MSEQTCCATQANYEHCKYSTNRGWRDTSRYAELFGTPERAARTIMGKQLTYDLLTQCDDCPYQTDECYEPSGKCAMDEYDTLLEWLRGDAE